MNNLKSPETLNLLGKSSKFNNIGIYFKKFNPVKGYFEMSVDMIRKYPDDYNHLNNDQNENGG